MRRRSFGFVVLLLLGCNDEGPSGTVGDTVMRVIVSTEGAFLDPDGYDVTVDGSVVRGVALDDDLTLPNVTPGEREVGLAGLEPGCFVDGENPRPVTAVLGAVAEVRIEVLCGSVIFGSDRSGNRELYRIRLDGTGLEPLTDDPATDFEPAVSSDGEVIAFTSTRDADAFEVFRIALDGTGLVQLTMEGGRSASWAPDGSGVAFETFRDGNTEIYRIDPDGTSPVNLSLSPASDDEAEWSPDGMRIVFASDREGDRAIFTMEADGSNPLRISPGEGAYPTWSADGERIAYVEGQGRTTIVTIRPDGTDLERIELPIRAFQLTWQPGTQLLFASEDTGQIHRLDLEGGQPIALTDHPTLDVTPAWGP